MRAIHIKFIFSIFLLYCIAAQADDFDEERVYRSDELYYLSINTPEDIQKK